MQEQIDQDRNIVAALAERRQVERDDVESVEQIAAEPAALDLLFEIAVGRREEPNVDRDGFCRADRNRPRGAAARAAA